MSTAMQRVGIVGGGTTAWLCAAALKQAFRHRSLDVLVLDTGRPGDDPIGRWTLPPLRSIHSLLGIKERDLFTQTAATFRLGSEHRGWQGDASRFVHVHGEIGLEINGTPFYHYLLRQALAGRPESAEEYSLAAVAARMGRFARPMAGQDRLTSSFTYGLHLDDIAYCGYLRAHAERLGVNRIGAALGDVTFLENGNVAALLASDGERIDADYFLDCSGREALLMQRLGAADREDWGGWLLNDRLLTAHAAMLEDLPPVTHTEAKDAGWLWRLPLARSSVGGYVYCSAFCSDDEALRQLGHYAPGISQPVLRHLQQGRRTRPWTSNCVAIGGAAIELEPLVGADLHVAQLGITLLIDLFPLDTEGRLEAIEYNRILGEHADALRDFTIAHYHGGAPRNGEYWAQVRALPPPGPLDEKLALYRANGRIVLRDHETFEAGDWAWLLLGSGVLPTALGLHVRTNLAGATPGQFAPLRASIGRLAASMPRHIEYVRHQSLSR